jgi:hypothetical protein
MSMPTKRLPLPPIRLSELKSGDVVLYVTLSRCVHYAKFVSMKDDTLVLCLSRTSTLEGNLIVFEDGKEMEMLPGYVYPIRHENSSLVYGGPLPYISLQQRDHAELQQMVESFKLRRE